MSLSDVVTVVLTILGALASVIEIRNFIYQRRSRNAGIPSNQESLTTPDTSGRVDDQSSGSGHRMTLTEMILRAPARSYVLSRVLILLSFLWLFWLAGWILGATSTAKDTDGIGFGLFVGDLPKLPIPVIVIIACVNLLWSGVMWHRARSMRLELNQMRDGLTTESNRLIQIRKSQNPQFDFVRDRDDEIDALRWHANDSNEESNRLGLPIWIYGIGFLMVAGSLIKLILDRAALTT